MKFSLLLLICVSIFSAFSQEKNVITSSCVSCHGEEANISFTLKQPAKVKVVVYNLIGQEVKTLANHVMTAGSHNLAWNWKTEKNANGVYLYKLETEKFAITHKMTLVK